MPRRDNNDKAAVTSLNFFHIFYRYAIHLRENVKNVNQAISAMCLNSLRGKIRITVEPL